MGLFDKSNERARPKQGIFEDNMPLKENFEIAKKSYDPKIINQYLEFKREMKKIIELAPGGDYLTCTTQTNNEKTKDDMGGIGITVIYSSKQSLKGQLPIYNHYISSLMKYKKSTLEVIKAFVNLSREKGAEKGIPLIQLNKEESELLETEIDFENPEGTKKIIASLDKEAEASLSENETNKESENIKSPKNNEIGHEKDISLTDKEKSVNEQEKNNNGHMDEIRKSKELLGVIMENYPEIYEESIDEEDLITILNEWERQGKGDKSKVFSHKNLNDFRNRLFTEIKQNAVFGDTYILNIVAVGRIEDEETVFTAEEPFGLLLIYRNKYIMDLFYDDFRAVDIPVTWKMPLGWGQDAGKTIYSVYLSNPEEGGLMDTLNNSEKIFDTLKSIFKITHNPSMWVEAGLDRSKFKFNRNIFKRLEGGYSNDALGCFEQAINLDPNYTSAWYNKGYILHKLGQKTEALECYDKALELDTGFKLPLAEKGHIYKDMENYPEALKYLEKFIEEAPNNSEYDSHIEKAKERIKDVKNKLGLEINGFDKNRSEGVDLKLNNEGILFVWKTTIMERYKDEGLLKYEEIDKIEYNKGILFGYIKIWLSNTKIKIENINHGEGPLFVSEVQKRIVNAKNNTKSTKTVETIDKTEIAEDSSNQDMKRRLEELDKKILEYYSQGNYQEALKTVNVALKIDPHNAKYVNNKGWIYKGLGDTEEAFNCFNRALEIDPEYAKAILGKGFLYYDHGDYSEALEYLEKGLKLLPSEKESDIKVTKETIKSIKDELGIQDSESNSEEYIELTNEQKSFNEQEKNNSSPMDEENIKLTNNEELDSGEEEKNIFSPMDEIRKAKELLDMSIITEEEFEKIKKKYI